MVFSLNGLNWINTFIIHLDISKRYLLAPICKFTYMRITHYNSFGVLYPNVGNLLFSSKNPYFSKTTISIALTFCQNKMATCSHEQLTEKDYLLLLLGIYIKHKLSDAILRDMIAMINFISGSNILPETLFKLFAPLKTYDSFEMHFYCAKCRNTHTSEDNRDTKMVCCDTICTNYFITFDMKEKIEKFLTVNASNIKCTRSNDNIIRDIFDGEVYKELSKTGFDPEKDLTFNFSLDGAPLSKSSTLQAWPIFITINEIDLKFRFKNIFTAGFWISSSQMTNDLNIKNLLTVFVNRMKILQNTGVTYKNDKITKISRIFPLYCVADAPAKAKILNFINHSGYYSCNYCEIHGIYESNAVRFPYGNNVQLRTKKEWQKCARIAMNTNKAVKGIKGSTPLTDLQGFNIIWGAPPDYMHIILLGVMRTLFELYFTNTGNPWYIGSPKQQNILPVEYYKHILHLRAGLMLLLKRAVAKDDMSNLFAYVQFLDDKSRNVVPVKDIKHFDPKTLEDFSKKKIFKIYWPQEDDQANLEKYERSIYEGTILDLGDGEVYLPKRKVYEYENKIINQKKKIKTLQNEMEVLKSRNAYLETDYDTLKEKLNRYESNAGIEESSCKEMLKVLLQETTEIKASLKTTLEEPSSRNKNKGNI
ncbi:hypothetical protein Avbf_08574 [Armadillidium vulgare]|nr:hypothetical protein Avbf_08574 [Armadillidium vulgare]